MMHRPFSAFPEPFPEPLEDILAEGAPSLNIDMNVGTALDLAPINDLCLHTTGTEDDSVPSQSQTESEAGPFIWSEPVNANGLNTFIGPPSEEQLPEVPAEVPSPAEQPPLQQPNVSSAMESMSLGTKAVPVIRKRATGASCRKMMREKNMRKEIKFSYQPLARRNVNKHIIRSLFLYCNQLQEEILQDCHEFGVDTKEMVQLYSTFERMQTEERKVKGEHKKDYARIIDWMLATPFRKIVLKHCILKSLSIDDNKRIRCTNKDVYVVTMQNYLDHIKCQFNSTLGC